MLHVEHNIGFGIANEYNGVSLSHFSHRRYVTMNWFSNLFLVWVQITQLHLPTYIDIGYLDC
jgi:hypothetical protein